MRPDWDDYVASWARRRGVVTSGEMGGIVEAEGFRMARGQYNRQASDRVVDMQLDRARIEAARPARHKGNRGPKGREGQSGRA